MAALYNPEIILGCIDTDRSKVDIWLLGIIILEMYSGKESWMANTVDETISKIQDTNTSDWDPLALISESTMSKMSQNGVNFVQSCLKRYPIRFPIFV